MSDSVVTSVSELLEGFVSVDIPSDYHISHLAIDSREVRANGMFIALKGVKQDGSQYVMDAIHQGANVILVEEPLDIAIEDDCLVIVCSELREKLGFIVARFYQYDPNSIDLIAVTGTNGKTSIAYLLAHILEGGYIGTLGLGIPQALTTGINTTPSPIVTQEVLQSLKDEGVGHCVMEVSSHAMTQARINGLFFDVAVFTNLTHEHLDYHGDMASYAEAKFSLFTHERTEHAVVNIDCEWGKKLVAQLNNVPVLTYAVKDKQADIHVNSFEQSLSGIKAVVSTPDGEGVLESPLFCEFNLYNLLAVLGVLLVKKMPLSNALSLIKQQTHIVGRMEVVHHEPIFVIDYAHTPDALEKALSNLKTLCQGTLWCVFGCGGNRDKVKRTLMGKIAESLADKIVITNDNPRFEEGQAIVDDILTGIKQPKLAKIELDRSKAIQYCFAQAKPKDVILIAGKGHETYQIINGETFHFSDHEVVKQLA